MKQPTSPRAGSARTTYPEKSEVLNQKNKRGYFSGEQLRASASPGVRDRAVTPRLMHGHAPHSQRQSCGTLNGRAEGEAPQLGHHPLAPDTNGLVLKTHFQEAALFSVIRGSSQDNF